MTDLTDFINAWTQVTTYYIIVFGFLLIFVLIILFVLSMLELYLGSNRPKKRLEQGFGGYLMTFSSTITLLYVFLVYFVIGAIFLSPILAYIRSLMTENKYPIYYYQVVSILIFYIISHYFISDRYRLFINRNNFYFVSKNTLILKFNNFYGYIPLSNVTEIQIDKENKIIKFVFKIRIFYVLRIKPRWLFEFEDEEAFNRLTNMTLRDYEQLKVEKHLKRKKFAKVLPRIPMGNETSFEQKLTELPEPIRNIFSPW